MIKYIVDGAVAGYAAAPAYIRLLENGSYGFCRAEQAEGIAVNGTPCRLAGHELPGCAEVTVETVPDGTFFAAVLAAEQEKTDYETALTALGVLPLEEVSADDANGTM